MLYKHLIFKYFAKMSLYYLNNLPGMALILAVDFVTSI